MCKMQKNMIKRSLVLTGIIWMAFCCDKVDVKAQNVFFEDYEQMNLIQDGAVDLPEHDYSFDESEECSIVYLADENSTGEETTEEELQKAAQLIRANNEETLEQRKQECAKVLYDGMCAMNSKIYVAQFALTKEEFKKVISDVVNSNPELFYIRNGYKVNSFPLAQDDDVQIVNYCCGYYEYQNDAGEPDVTRINELKKKLESKKRKILSDIIVNGMSDTEKLLVIHDYIVLNTMYDYEAYLEYKASSGADMSKYFSDRDFDIYGTLVDGKAVCQGYTLTFKYLAEAAGVDNIGFSSNTAHIWNTVTLNGKSYYVDCTWDDPTWDTLGNVKHTNFLKSKQVFAQNHTGISETDRVCDSKLYDDAFWNNVFTAFIYYRGYYYYVGEDGCLWKTKLQTLEDMNADKVFVADLNLSFTKSWDNKNSAKITLAESVLLYHDGSQVYYYNLKTGKMGTACSLELSENELIYGIQFTDGVFYYATRKQNVSGGAVSFANTEQKIYEGALPKELFEIPVESIGIKGEKQLKVFMKDGQYIGEREQLTADVLPENATDKRILQWISSDNEVAVVDINGMVCAIKPGTVTITAVSYDGRVEGNFTLQVVYDGDICDANGKTVYYEQGEKRTSQFYVINGKQCYLNEEGYYVTGWREINGKWYYFDADGSMMTGWQNIAGKKYLLASDGSMQTGWHNLDGKIYYLNENGVMLTGWQTISGKRYYFDADGTMQKGWIILSKDKYYLDEKGVMLTGWASISNKKYYFNENGVLQTGWKTISKKRYYFDKKGSMQTGWKTIKKKKYYFNSKGVMQTGWKTIKKKRYYFNNKGIMQTGWKAIKGKKYYFNGKGVMLTGKRTVKGISYYFAPDGHLVS